MSTIWQHQIFVIGAAAAASGVIAALDVAFPRDDGQPRDPSKVLDVACPMSASGTSPITHYGSSFVITEAIRLKLDGLGLPATPGVLFWRCSNPDGILTATNHPGSLASVGQSWAWQNCQDAAGLKQVLE